MAENDALAARDEARLQHLELENRRLRRMIWAIVYAAPEHYVRVPSLVTALANGYPIRSLTYHEDPRESVLIIRALED